MRAVWNVEPWTGVLSLDAQGAYALLDRLVSTPDPDLADRLFAAFEEGALAGWAVLKARKD